MLARMAEECWAGELGKRLEVEDRFGKTRLERLDGSVERRVGWRW